MRMLFITRESYPTHRVDIDVLFARHLVGRGHEIDFVMQAANQDVSTGRQSWNGRTVFIGRTDTREGIIHRLSKHCMAAWHDLTSLRLMSPDRYDVVQLKDKFFIAAIAVVFARLRGLQVFYWLSFPIPESETLRAMQGSARYPFIARLRGAVTGWMLYKWILPKSDYIFVQSQRMKEDVCGKGVEPSKVTAVPMGIEVEDFPLALTYRPAAVAGRVRLGYLGVLAAERRLDILAEIVSQLLCLGFDVSLLVVGDGHSSYDRDCLVRRAADLGVGDRLEITGFLPRREALARIANTDVCLSPFFPTPILDSTSPTKLVEYLALGIPVVANRHPEQQLVLRESRGGVCVPWGARYFVQGIRWLMRHSEAERATIGQCGRAWVLNHRTYDRIADNLEYEYRRITASKGQ